jgi:hypothetical protein
LDVYLSVSASLYIRVCLPFVTPCPTQASSL